MDQRRVREARDNSGAAAEIRISFGTRCPQGLTVHKFELYESLIYSLPSLRG